MLDYYIGKRRHTVRVYVCVVLLGELLVDHLREGLVWFGCYHPIFPSWDQRQNRQYHRFELYSNNLVAFI